MQIEDQKKENVLVVRVLEKRLDAHVATDFKDKMNRYISNGNRLIVLNFSEVDFIDSSGLGAIVSSLKMMGGEGDLVICGLKDLVLRMFKLTRMDRVFNIFDNEKEAVDALSKEEDIDGKKRC